MSLLNIDYIVPRRQYYENSSSIIIVDGYRFIQLESYSGHYGNEFLPEKNLSTSIYRTDRLASLIFKLDQLNYQFNV
jgi:hypothetical protein